jgi:hypothetical protein
MRMSASRKLLLAAALSIASSSAALAQGTADDANKSNNPLSPEPGFNIQNSYAPDLYGSDKYTNDVLLRGTLPLPPVRFIRVPQLIRATIPISTRPKIGGGYTTGLGDINLLDVFLTQSGQNRDWRGANLDHTYCRTR